MSARPGRGAGGKPREGDAKRQLEQKACKECAEMVHGLQSYEPAILLTDEAVGSHLLITVGAVCLAGNAGRIPPCCVKILYFLPIDVFSSFSFPTAGTL